VQPGTHVANRVDGDCGIVHGRQFELDGQHRRNGLLDHLQRVSQHDFGLHSRERQPDRDGRE